MQDVPRTTLTGATDEDDDIMADADEDENMDVRHTEHRNDKHVARDDEFDDGDEEEANLANGAFAQNGQVKQRNHTYSDVDMDSGVPTPEIEVHDETEDAPTAVTEANAKVNAELMEQKTQDVAATETLEVGPSNAPSRSNSPKPIVDDEGDIDMAEPLEATDVALVQEKAEKSPVPPTASAKDPPKASIATDTEAAASSEQIVPETAVPKADPVILKQESDTERQDANVTAEASKENAEQNQS